MLTDIKHQLTRMQDDAERARSETVAAAGRDAEAIAAVIRDEIRRAMMVRGKSGVTIQDTIDKEVARLEGEGEDAVGGVGGDCDGVASDEM